MIFEGNIVGNKKEGFGRFTLPKALYSSALSSNGKWEGEYFVYQGLFKDDAFVTSCVKASDCKTTSKK